MRGPGELALRLESERCGRGSGGETERGEGEEIAAADAVPARVRLGPGGLKTVGVKTVGVKTGGVKR